jgi:hypothetical protein
MIVIKSVAITLGFSLSQKALVVVSLMYIFKKKTQKKEERN